MKEPERDDAKPIQTDTLCGTCKHSMVVLVAVKAPKKSSISHQFKLEAVGEVFRFLCKPYHWPIPPNESVQACTDWEPGPEKQLKQAGDIETPKTLQ